MKNSSLFTFLMIIGLHLHGQTNLPSVISSNTTLSKLNSPYLISNLLTIQSGITLTIDAGCIILFGTNAGINVIGSIYAGGTESENIIFKSQVDGKSWNSISSNGFQNIDLNFVTSTGGISFVFVNTGNSVKISHCNITSMATGSGQDCIAAEYVKKISIEYIELKGQGGKIANGSKNDAIDLDAADSCFVNHNHVWNFSDDAIDIGTGTKYALITDNIVHNTNFGITVGEASTAYLFNNITFHNDGGFQVHTAATIYCDRNTIYENTDGIECYHSEDGEEKQTGGIAYIKNTLFSKNIHHDITKQSSTFDTISYSLSDRDILSGWQNLHSDPLLTDPANYNFRLQTTSPCIGAGMDTSGNKIDIGAEQLVDIALAVHNNFEINPKAFIIYPNPTNEYIKIETSTEIGNAEIDIFDVSGKEYLRQKNYKSKIKIDISNLPAGVYIIKILPGNMESKKMIKI